MEKPKPQRTTKGIVFPIDMDDKYKWWKGGQSFEQTLRELGMAEEVSIVNHPPHYNSGKIEVIEAIEDWKLSYHRGQVIKYTARAGKKDPTKEIEDLEKAAWYLRRDIENMKAQRDGRSPVRPNDMNPRDSK